MRDPRLYEKIDKPKLLLCTQHTHKLYRMTFKYIKNEQGQFVCPHCPFTSGPQSTMHYHIKKNHDGDLKHVCKFCKNKFVQKSLLDLHMKSQHKEELDKRVKQFCCPFPNCDVKDLRKGNVISHFCRVHLKDLLEKALLISKTKEEPAIQCTHCKKGFASKPSFNYHIASCLKPTQTHPCYDSFQKLATLEAMTV